MSKLNDATKLFLVWTTAVYSAFVMCETTPTRTTAGFVLRHPPLFADGVQGECQLSKVTVGIRRCLSLRRRLLLSSLARSTTRGDVLSMAFPSRAASLGLFAAGMVGSCISGGMSSNFRLYRTVPDIPNAMFRDHASIKATVISVSDGDSIRVRHIPTIPLPLPGRGMQGKTSEETLQIRLYAVDCPEVAHFGNSAQPLSSEAKEFTKRAIQGKNVKIKLLRLDQYQRAVCKVKYGRWPFRKDVSAELLKEGLGVLYRQGGAEYDGQERKLSRIEASAKERKAGVWKKVGAETPAQYKARIKRGQTAGA